MGWWLQSLDKKCLGSAERWGAECPSHLGSLHLIEHSGEVGFPWAQMKISQGLRLQPWLWWPKQLKLALLVLRKFLGSNCLVVPPSAAHLPGPSQPVGTAHRPQGRCHISFQVQSKPLLQWNLEIFRKRPSWNIRVGVLRETSEVACTADALVTLQLATWRDRQNYAQSVGQNKHNP